MTLLSIDIGIKNLALCIIDSSNKIIYWDVLNICSNITEPIPTNTLCCSYCKNKAKYKKSANNYCMKHAKSQTEYIIPTGELQEKRLNKCKVDQIKTLMDNYKIEYNTTSTTKKQYIELITTRLLDSINMNTPDTKVSEYNLIDISRIMTIKLDKELATYIPNITEIVIENQISPIATRMKSIQSMVTQYFVMKCNVNTQILYVSAMNKLKGITTNSYKDRKKASIHKCKDILIKSSVESEADREWLEYFNKHKKKDDLSDCYIQGLWYINKNV